MLSCCGIPFLYIMRLTVLWAPVTILILFAVKKKKKKEKKKKKSFTVNPVLNVLD